MTMSILKSKAGYFFICTLIISFVLLLSSCNRLLGYGVLLWSSEYPPVPSGTVLPVHIRSNIDRVWVVGIPGEYMSQDSAMDKFEVPLAQLELVGSRGRAMERAETFAPFALVYAENLQDGLPIRERADNVSRRVYRLRLGEIIKILGPASGAIPVGASGEQLEGAWYQVMTEDGTVGYCFSYRLYLFEHPGGVLVASRYLEIEEIDEDLDLLLSRSWSPETYGTMVNNRRIDLNEFSNRWSFDPGAETGIARINVRGLERSFSYTRIRSIGTRTWQFEGTRLQMSLRSDTTLAVQFTEENGLLRTLVFVALRTSVDDIILQETVRREALFSNIFQQGPAYTSINYGTIVFSREGHFSWAGNDLLMPQVIPVSALGSGSIDMRLFISDSLAEIYDGAFTMLFDGIGGNIYAANFMYRLDSTGFRIEHVPQTSLDGNVVVRRASSPLIIFFLRDDMGLNMESGLSSDPFGLSSPEKDFFDLP